MSRYLCVFTQAKNLTCAYLHSVICKSMYIYVSCVYIFSYFIYTYIYFITCFILVSREEKPWEQGGNTHWMLYLSITGHYAHTLSHASSHNQTMLLGMVSYSKSSQTEWPAAEPLTVTNLDVDYFPINLSWSDVFFSSYAPAIFRWLSLITNQFSRTFNIVRKTGSFLLTSKF